MNTSRMAFFILLMLLCIPLTFTTAQSALPETQDNANAQNIIRIGSKAFDESEILSWLIYLKLEDAGYRVLANDLRYGVTEEVFQGLQDGIFDVYVEYTGTGFARLYRQFPEQINFDNGYDPLATLTTVTAFDSAYNDLIWLPPSPANNVYALTVTEAFVEETGIITLEEFADYVNNGGEVVLTASDFFVELDEALPSFQSTYGFELAPAQLNIIPQAQPNITLAALLNGEAGTNVAMAYGTTGELAVGEYIILQDTLNAQLVFQPAPIFRGEVIRNNPDILPLLKPVFEQLEGRTLRDLNAAVSIFGDDPQQAARDWLVRNNFITVTAEDAAAMTISCEVFRSDLASASANLRSGPGLEFDVVGNLPAGNSQFAEGQATDVDGFVWWKLVIGPWVRSDVVQQSEESDCDALPLVSE
jgi:osmoprotectant transport system substrate-binding protein